MENKIIARFLLFVFLASFSSCFSLKALEFRSLEDIKLQELSSSTTLLSLDMTYFNPNNATLKLKKAEGRVFINNILLGGFQLDSLIRISRRAEFTLPLNIIVDRKKLLPNALTALLNPAVLIRFEGKAKVGKGIIYFHYPFYHEQEFNLMELLK